VTTYALGLDYGTNSVRAVVVRVDTGEEVGTAVWDYAIGDHGILTDPRQPELARQHPRDYIEGLERSVRAAMDLARSDPEFSPRRIIGIGVDTTGSTPIPVDARGEPLALQPQWSSNLHALAWLWKDHTAHEEALEITSRARELRPAYLAKCGGVYSSEWFWSKLLHCRRVAPDVFAAAYTWVECCDWIPALLTGRTSPSDLPRSICAAGHKAMFHPDWGGYPDEEFLSSLDPELARVRRTLPDRAQTIAQAAGALTEEWAARLGLPAGIPVATGAFDAHLGAVGSGIEPGTMVKILGTSSCDLAVAPLSDSVPDIPGVCGIVPESVLPGHHGIEAGQSAVGDIYNWFVQRIQPGGPELARHERLSAEASRLAPGESGLLALDWHNGNRTVLVDPRLTGLVLGLTLQTTPVELYRAWIESTAMGARVIVERLEEYRVPVRRVVVCGGISVRNRLVLQIYADVLGRPLEVAQSTQTCALGAAMAGAVVAGPSRGGHPDFASAVRAMTGVLPESFRPQQDAAAVYSELYSLYRRLHDAFGGTDRAADLSDLMKSLLRIRDRVRIMRATQ